RRAAKLAILRSGLATRRSRAACGLLNGRLKPIVAADRNIVGWRQERVEKRARGHVHALPHAIVIRGSCWPKGFLRSVVFRSFTLIPTFSLLLSENPSRPDRAKRSVNGSG